MEWICSNKTARGVGGLVPNLKHEAFRDKDENIGFNGYIGTWILRIYRIYRRFIDEYFYMNIDISEIKLL